MIYGIGTDLCPVERMQEALKRPRFAARVCAPEELARLEAMSPARRAEHLAGLFAAKEAVSKALGTGFAGFGFADIAILPDGAGRPRVRLSGGAARFSDLNIHVTITHDAGLALAFAVAETAAQAGRSERGETDCCH